MTARISSPMCGDPIALFDSTSTRALVPLIAQTISSAYRQLSPHTVKMAMAVQGDKNRRYHWDSIFRRHWQSTARHCGMAPQFHLLIDEIVEDTPKVIAEIGAGLPDNFPAFVAGPVLKGLSASSKRLADVQVP
jgi:hypothetical protein